MAGPQPVSGLIEKIEAAGGNDPDLFWEAFAAVRGPKPERAHGGSKELDDYLAKSNPFFYMLKAGAFIDAAMTLVPENCAVDLTIWAGRNRARILPVYHDAGDRWLHRGSDPHFCADAATPALAICAAALKARARETTPSIKGGDRG